MFLSQHVTGIRALVFHCSEEQLRKLCLLHGLEVGHTCTVQDLKLRLLYHVLNGDCLTKHCESSRPSPDRTACLCIATGFSSSLDVTTFVVNLLKDSMPSVITTEDLLLVVQSTGDQSSYKTRLSLRHRVLASLQTFTAHCHRRTQRDVATINQDPFGDLFMGFEDKRKAVLESVMNHHGLLINRESKLSSEGMRRAIVTHILSGHCARLIDQPSPWTSQRVHNACPVVADETEDVTCNDFVRDANLHAGDNIGNEIKLLNKILDKRPSRSLLLRVLICKDIPYEASQSRKSLQTTLTRFVRLLEKRRITSTAMSVAEEWPLPVSVTLKDKIAENFRNEIS